MISLLRYALLTDGTSDQALMPLLHLLLLQSGTPLPLSGTWANPRFLPAPAQGLAARLEQVLKRYPCDLLFMHRDAERQNPQMRYEEITDALAGLDAPPPVICVVPVRMTEAWLLTDEAAIRRAADNPHGSVALSLPALHTVESIPDPKQKLFELLRAASEKSGRRLDQFKRDEVARRLRVAELTVDISPLQRLTAFQRLQSEVQQLMQSQGWV